MDEIFILLMFSMFGNICYAIEKSNLVKHCLRHVKKCNIVCCNYEFFTPRTQERAEKEAELEAKNDVESNVAQGQMFSKTSSPQVQS